MSTVEPPAGASEVPKRVGPVRLVALAAGLIAGLLATAGGEFTYPAFHQDLKFPANLDAMSGFEKTTARARARFQARVADERNKATAAFGLLGASVGLCIGVAGLLLASGRSTPAGAIIGGLAGGLAGAGIAWGLVPVFFESSDAQTGLPLLFVTHLAIFSTIGAAGGLAFATALANRRLIVRCMVGGVLGVLVGTFVVEVINFVAFPLARMYEPVPLKFVPRLLLNLWVAAGVALGIGLAAAKRLREPKAA